MECLLSEMRETFEIKCSTIFPHTLDFVHLAFNLETRYYNLDYTRYANPS